MNFLSTNKSLYRYKISQTEDISESTYHRRLVKSEQNNKKCFFFEVDESFEKFSLVLDFIKTKIRPQDYIQTNIKNHMQIGNIIKPSQCVLNITNHAELAKFIDNKEEYKKISILLTPKTKSDLYILSEFQKNNNESYNIFWSFTPYNPSLKNSLTVKDINKSNIHYKTIPGLEIINNKIPVHYELQPMNDSSYKTEWIFSVPNAKPIISVIIPSYNNVQFLSNVVWHLLNQNTSKAIYEIIIADDGSQDHSSKIILSLFEKYKNKVNIQYIYWSKHHALHGNQNFFRAGLARNLATHHCSGEYLLFLDSDMLVPENFIDNCISELKQTDIIQFQRFHISQELSKTNPTYNNINLAKDTYIEEESYWSELFFCNKWTDLPNYWKYTCTYALGISKDIFFDIGMFKKYYISYGFEDTDIGYEAHKKNCSFKLIKVPLLHLTSYDKMQYRNSFTKRFNLLRVTAELFYLQHLDKNIYHLLGNYYRMQKPFKSFLKDLIS